MNLTLTREKFQEDGIFSVLKDESGKVVASTIERAYEQPDGSYAPKLQPGVYTCKRGSHRLHGMTADFETFEVTGVKGHSGILFHVGNYNKDSDGCILLGEKRVAASKTAANSTLMVTNSKLTFAKFLELERAFQAFQLTVI